MRVLIATQEPSQFAAWRSTLEAEGVEVQFAVPDRQALGRAMRGQVPDVAVLHLTGTGERPAEFRRLLVQLYLGSQVKLVVVAARNLLAELADEELDDLLEVTAAPEEVLFRMRRLADWEHPVRELEMGELVIRPAERQALVSGQPVELRYREFELLWFLATHPDRVFRREELIRHVWGSGFEGSPRTVDVHITRLRERLGEFGQSHLRSVRRVGYSLSTPQRLGALR